MNIIVIIKFMRISFEVSSVAATKLPSFYSIEMPVHWHVMSLTWPHLPREIRDQVLSSNIQWIA